MLAGVVFAFTSGLWHLALLSLATPLFWLLTRRIISMRNVPIDAPVQFEPDAVYIGDYRLPKFQIFWKPEWNRVVHAAYLAISAEPEFDLKLDLVETGTHALIIGPTGSGKSQLIKLLFDQFIERTPGCEFWLFDFKGGATFLNRSNVPQSTKFITDIDGHDRVAIWSNLELELAKREATLASHGAARIEDLSPATMSTLFVLVDELGTALNESIQAHSALTAVVSRGRSLGVHFVGATQTLSGVPRAMLANIRARIALGEVDSVDLAVLNLKLPQVAPLAPDGWTVGLAQIPGKLSSYFFLPLKGSY